LIINRQRAKGWGNSVVEKLASDVQKAFPGIEGFSPRNIWRMRAFHLAWGRSEGVPPAVDSKDRKKLPRAMADLESQFLPQAVAEIPWGHNVTLLEKLNNTTRRLWYAQQATANGWSRSMLMNFYLAAVDDQLRHPEDKLSIGLILCKTRSRVIAEYALRNVSTPVGVARYTTKLMESLPAELKDSLPSLEAIEAELESQERLGKGAHRKNWRDDPLENTTPARGSGN
jgi:hypothetical protein